MSIIKSIRITNAVVTKITDFGAFARLDNRIEGLIHISEISNKNVNHPRDLLEEGQELQVRIIHIDPERQRMGLSLKQVDDDDENDDDWREYQSTESDDADADVAGDAPEEEGTE